MIHVDDHQLSWQDFGHLLLTYAGWGMRVAFVPDDQTIETAVVEVRDLADDIDLIRQRLAVTERDYRERQGGG